MTNSVMMTDPFGFNAQRVPTTGAARSWTIAGRGSLSAEIINSDLTRLGLNSELRGRWISIDDDDAGLWGGVITDAQARSDGTTEVAAEDYRALMNAIRTPRRARGLHGPAGTIAMTLINESTRSIGSHVRARYADDLGAPLDLTLDGADLRSKLDALATEAGQEWWIDEDDLTLRWGIKGDDLTGSVQLIEGRHLADWSAPESVDPVYNDLLATPSAPRASKFASVRVENGASIAAVGLRQTSTTLTGGTYGIHIKAKALGLLDDMVAAGRTIEARVVNVDRCFASFREGDYVSLLLASVSARAYVRITGRSLDETNVMRISGTVYDREVLA